jgi:hypothetical protein
MRLRLRLLPVLIFSAALLLSVRVGGLWQELTVEVGAISVAEIKPAAGSSAKPGAVKPARKPAGGIAKKTTRPKAQAQAQAKAKAKAKAKPTVKETVTAKPGVHRPIPTSMNTICACCRTWPGGARCSKSASARSRCAKEC